MYNYVILCGIIVLIGNNNLYDTVFKVGRRSLCIPLDLYSFLLIIPLAVFYVFILHVQALGIEDCHILTHVTSGHISLLYDYMNTEYIHRSIHSISLTYLN